MKNIIIDFLLLLKLDRIFNLLFVKIPFKFKIRRYELQSKQKINFIAQGSYTLSLLGDLNNFKIHETSHLKSDTVIECSGGVEIGKYFHTGKGLTVFSASHNWKDGCKIPYDEKIIPKKVVINDFVWLGTNVTILPGVEIGEGAIIAAGSVVVKNVAEFEIVGGNPAKLISSRDTKKYNELKIKKSFF
ncbi:acyltransferase [Wenyingzhuangia sp. IMCC45467]